MIFAYDLYKCVAENFKFYIDNLNQSDLDEIDADMVSRGVNSIKSMQNSTELLMLFDYFFLLMDVFQQQTNIPLYPELIFPLR